MRDLRQLQLQNFGGAMKIRAAHAKLHGHQAGAFRVSQPLAPNNVASDEERYSKG